MMNPKVEDLSGKIFGRWTVVRRVASDKNGNARFLCKCCCGNEREVLAFTLRHGGSTTCDDCRALHSDWGSPEYAAWNQAIQRCHNPKNPGFNDYGGRGIQVCEIWRASFHAFVAHVGPRPTEDHSIDRINNDGNYEPGNVKWSTQIEQANNRRPARRRQQNA